MSLITVTPKRSLLRRNKRLPEAFVGIRNGAFLIFFRTVQGLDDGIWGMIMVTHTFTPSGITLGFISIFTPSSLQGCFDRTGSSHRLPKGDLKRDFSLPGPGHAKG